MRRSISRALVALPVSVAGLAVVAVAPPSFAVNAAAPSDAGAVFVQTDDLAHNSVVAFRRGSDGTLTRVGEFSTGGRGGVERDVPLDSLASRAALVSRPERVRPWAVALVLLGPLTLLAVPVLGGSGRGRTTRPCSTGCTGSAGSWSSPSWLPGY